MSNNDKPEYADIYCSTEARPTRHEKYPGRYICTECGAECRKDGFRLDKRILPPDKTIAPRTGKKGRPSLITEAQRAAVLEMRRSGGTLREIADALDIKPWVVAYMLKGVKEVA